VARQGRSSTTGLDLPGAATRPLTGLVRARKIEGFSDHVDRAIVGTVEHGSGARAAALASEPCDRGATTRENDPKITARANDADLIEGGLSTGR